MSDIPCNFQVDLIRGREVVTLIRHAHLPFFPRAGDSIWVVGLGLQDVVSVEFDEMSRTAAVWFPVTDMSSWSSWERIRDEWMLRYGWAVDDEITDHDPFESEE